ncbi:MAG TPA: methyltransferase, partial [Candidatus Eisenbacteria bacterium]|nr:methyltransferase [Candidatus Eisenbacteria bacterium]
LDALSAMGLLHKRAWRYRNSPFALRHLCSGSAAFLLPEHDAWDVWRALPELLTTGKRPKAARPFSTDRKGSERLLRSLDRDARKIAPYLIERVPMEASKSLLDVGGGLGSFALVCCRRFRQLRATVIEHPRIAPLARRSIRNAPAGKRVQVIALDIAKEPLPRGFDVVLISNVLHGQGERENRRLIKSAHDALHHGGRLLLRDVLMNRERTDPEWGALFSVSLLLHTPRGRCYALDDVHRWLRRAGFSSIDGPFRSSPLFFDPDSIVIATKS